MSIHSELKSGFRYDWELFDKDGQLVEKWSDMNLMPTQGLNYMLETSFRGGAPSSTWYIAVYANDYTPTPAITAAAFASTAGECITYTPALRPAFTPSAASAGAIDNSAAKAEFVSTATTTLYGGAIMSSSGKGATTGSIASIVRFSSPKTFATGSTLRVTAGLVFVSA